MSHPLQQRIRGLRRRALRLLAIRGLSLMLAAVLATVIALGWIDHWARFQDRGVLVVFAAAVLAVFAWTGYRAVRRFLDIRLGDADVALHVEACFPAVKNRLASAVEFLRQPDEDVTAGSAAMRRAAISQATAASERLDFASVLDRRPATRAALAALLVGGLALGLVLADAAAARTALVRLAFPLGAADWPQRTHLALRQPIHTVVRGQPLEVEVIDTGNSPLPADCCIHFRLADTLGRTREETEPMQLVGNVAVARRENMSAPLEFRCTGGDDQGWDWNEVRVIEPPEPPAVRSLALKITPPDYTNWPAEDRDATSPRPILAGSHVQISGKATKRLKPASQLRFDDGRTMPIAIEADGMTFHAGMAGPQELVIEKSTGYSLHLVDVDGCEGGGDQRWQFRVLADAAPIAILEQPAGDLFVTDKAVVRFRVSARDDLALREVTLVFRSSDPKIREKSLMLWEGPDLPPRSVLSAFESGAAGEQQTFDPPAQELSEFHLAPGTQLTCFATASDYHAQTGRSDPRVLNIVTADQLLARMAVRQNQIVAELARLLKLQRDSTSQVDMSVIRLRETAGLAQSQIDPLQSAEFSEREIARGLTSNVDGLPAQVQSLLSDLATNRVDSPDLQRRMEGLLAEFERLGRDHLPQISAELTAAIKGSLVRLQSSPQPVGLDSASEGHLAAASEHQRQVVTALANMLAGMRRWEDYRRFHGEVAQLLRDQEFVARNTTEMGGQTIGRDVKELSPQESAELKIMAERQLELARRETRLEQEMEQTVAALGQGEPLAAGILTDAVAEARRLAIAADMSTAGGKIRANGLGLAPVDQQRILENLQEVLDILTNNRQQELGRLAKKLDEAEKELGAIRKRQADLRRRLQQMDNRAGEEQPKAALRKLAGEQEELRQEMLPLARRLERLMADDVAGGAEKAIQEMGNVSLAADRGDRKGASDDAKLVDDALADTVRKLREKRFEVESGRSMEEQARLRETLQRLETQEQHIADQTGAFAEMEQRGRLDRTQIDRLLRLAREQELLRDDASRIMQALDPTNPFRAGLSLPVEEMGRASVLLLRRQIGSPAQEAEHAAIERLKMLLAATEPESKGAPGNPAGSPDQNIRSEDHAPSGVLPLAQLKVLKLLQEDLNLRTRQLNQAESAGKPTEDLRERYSLLHEEQDRLAELTVQLLHPPSHDSEHGGEPKENLP
jgi:hypothetical protein